MNRRGEPGFTTKSGFSVPNDCGQPAPDYRQQRTMTIRSLILDMDGVLWHDDEPIGDLPAIFAEINKLGLRVVFATNNATKTVRQFTEKLRSFGVGTEPWQIITSAVATAHFLKQKHPEGGSVYVVGESGLLQILEESGFRHTTQNPLAVVAGMDRGITYEKLRQATLLIRAGVPFIGTNPDRTFPTPEGLVPGAGTILAAIETASDTAPQVIGKPSPTMYRFALERLGTPAAETPIVGDRLETDILGAQRLGSPCALVLSGVTTRAQAEAWQPPPDMIAENLAEVVQKLSL